MLVLVSIMFLPKLPSSSLGFMPTKSQLWVPNPACTCQVCCCNWIIIIYEWHMNEHSSRPSLITLPPRHPSRSFLCIPYICCVYKTKLSAWNTVGKSELLRKKLPISSWVRNKENNRESWKEMKKPWKGPVLGSLISKCLLALNSLERIQDSKSQHAFCARNIVRSHFVHVHREDL